MAFAENKRPIAEPPPLNPFGLVGLVLSVLGVFTCGLLSPLGLLFSTIGLFKPPRGLAAFGVILGIAGSGGLMLLGLVIFTSYLHHYSVAEKVKVELEAAEMMEEASDKLKEATEDIRKAQKELDVTPEIERALREFDKIREFDEATIPRLDKEGRIAPAGQEE